MIGIRRAVLEDAENLFDAFRSCEDAPSLETLISLLKDDSQHFYTLWEGRELLGGFCFSLSEGRAELELLLPLCPSALEQALALAEARYPGLSEWTAPAAPGGQTLRKAGFVRRKGMLVRTAVRRPSPPLRGEAAVCP